jgi:hypothetical protein
MKSIPWMNPGPCRRPAILMTLTVILAASFGGAWSHAAPLNQTVPTRTPSPAPTDTFTPQPPAPTATLTPLPPTVPPTLTPVPPAPTATPRHQDTTQPPPASTPVPPQPTLAPTPPTLPVTGASANGDVALLLIALAAAGALLPLARRDSRKEAP